MKSTRILILSSICLISLAFLFIYACDSGSGDERKSCIQDRDCGEEGRTKYTCANGLCYLNTEYCTSDDQCVGKCLENACESGRIDSQTDGDALESDQPNTESDSENVEACPHECCSDKECWDGSKCDPIDNKCVAICHEECCRDEDCQRSDKFGADFVCRSHKCEKKTTECKQECCSDADCQTKFGNDWKCNPTTGTCEGSCNPNDKKCCDEDKGHPYCLSLEANYKEGVLTCAKDGKSWEGSLCDPKFTNCSPHASSKTEVECTANSRCETNTDCSCPTTECMEQDGKKRCVVPEVKADELCWGKQCGGEIIGEIGRCPAGHVCCKSQTDENSSYCKPTAECTTN